LFGVIKRKWGIEVEADESRAPHQRKEAEKMAWNSIVCVFLRKHFVKKQNKIK
jgi:hypothetical protein